MVNCKVLLYFLFLIRSSTSQLSTNCHDRINDNALSGNLGYKVIAGQRYFTPGDIVRVKVLGSSASTIRGITVYAVEGGNTDVLVGDWLPPVRKYHKSYRSIQCDDHINMMVVERSWSDKKTPAEFIWAAPNDCINGSSFYIRVKIYESMTQAQSSSIFLKCRHESLESICPFNSKGLDTNYNESFEGKIKNWVNSGGRDWLKRTRETPSYKTGPEKAFHGYFYIYSEASEPSQPGSVAALTTKNSLIGCFCLQFALSMNISPFERHMFEVLANEITVFSTSIANKNWTNYKVQFNENDFVKVTLKATRGRYWRGDIAVDDIKISNGICVE